MTSTIFVGCLKMRTTENDLFHAFSKVGDIVDVSLKKDEFGNSKKWAFITYKDPKSAQRAVDELNDTIQCDCCVNVQFKRTNPNKQNQFNPNYNGYSSRDSRHRYDSRSYGGYTSYDRYDGYDRMKSVSNYNEDNSNDQDYRRRREYEDEYRYEPSKIDYRYSDKVPVPDDELKIDKDVNSFLEPMNDNPTLKQKEEIKHESKSRRHRHKHHRHKHHHRHHHKRRTEPTSSTSESLDYSTDSTSS